MKLHPPKKCPFCGEGKVIGGGDRMVYYDCGAHIWIEKQHDQGFVLRGHDGGCAEKQET